MVGFRQCEGCKKELPEELFREGSPQCRTCAREKEQRNPVVRIAASIVAEPREQWAKELIARLRKRGANPAKLYAAKILHRAHGTTSNQLSG